MPRHARLQSATGIYHVMIRGNNREDIFHEPADFEKMLYILKECVEVTAKNFTTSPMEIYAFCLMNNHVHLLLKEDENGLAYFMKRFSVRYAQYYKRKYAHVGHLFQDRFKSLPVEDEEYLLATYRYIARNPVKAMLCGDLREYPYSSFNRRFDWVYPLPSCYDAEQVQEFVFSEQEEIDPFREQLSDAEVKALFLKVCKIKTASEFVKKEKSEQKKLISLLHYYGLSVRQIGELTGIPKSTIARRLS